jgi:hypothetical protein
MASATKRAQAANLINAPALALETIGRKYHSKMRMVDASSDSLSDGVVVPALREAIVEGVLERRQPAVRSAGREAAERQPHAHA